MQKPGWEEKPKSGFSEDGHGPAGWRASTHSTTARPPACVEAAAGRLAGGVFIIDRPAAPTAPSRTSLVTVEPSVITAQAMTRPADASSIGAPGPHLPNTFPYGLAEPPQTGSSSDLQPPQQQNRHPALRLRGGAGELDGDIIDNWERISRLLFQQAPAERRSLKEVDQAVRRWKEGGRRSPHRLERNARELRDVLNAIDQWEAGDHLDPTGTTIIDLRQRIQEELADVNHRLIPPITGKPMAVASHPADDDDNATRGVTSGEATQRMVPAARDLQIARWLRASDPGAATQQARAELARLREGINRLGPGSSPRLRQALQHQADRIEEDLQIFTSIRTRSPQLGRRLREPQATALVVVERRGRQAADRDYTTARNRVQQAVWAHGYSRLNTDDLLRTVHEHLRSGMRLTTNMPRRAIENLLADPEGKFRGYWESGTTGGTDDRARRVKIEEVFGYAASLGRSRGLTGPEIHRQGDLPKYAALMSPLRPSGLRHFGDVVLVWKPQVKARTTFTPQDSFSWTDLHAAEGAPGVTGPDHLYPLLAYGADDVVRLAFAEATNFVYDPELRAAFTAGKATDGYFEGQIHGDLHLSDLHEIVINHHEGWHHEAEQDRAKILAHAQRKGLDLRVKLFRIGTRIALPEPNLNRNTTHRGTGRDRRDHDVPVFSAFTRSQQADQLDQQTLDQAIADRKTKINTLTGESSPPPDPATLHGLQESLQRLERVRDTWNPSSQIDWHESSYSTPDENGEKACVSIAVVDLGTRAVR
jgi:hypothetical protein